MNTEQSFPDGFLWGAGTAAHQVEGDNINSDNWVLEHLPGTLFREPSGDACDLYHRYPDDISVLAGLGLNAFRFGIEWARIEPECGAFSNAALDHYSRMVDACLARGVTPVVTLHHFTSPRWLISQGGWRSQSTVGRFGEYAHRVMSRIGDRVEWVCTINEANVPLQLSQAGLIVTEAGGRFGDFLATAAQALGSDDPIPGIFFTAIDETSINVLNLAHREAVDAVHAANSSTMAGVTLSLQEVEAIPGGEAAAESFDEMVNRWFLREMGAAGDFVGVQNYTRIRFGADGVLPASGELTGANLELVPGSLAATCRQANDVSGRPVLVTEHGADLGDARDDTRGRFIQSSLVGLHEAIATGVDVRGYLHWTLMDNFEWFNGYHGQFGLLGVDRATQRRWVRPSATVLGDIARRNAL